MENFTPVASGIGGIMIGLAVAAMLLFSGRIAGISGIWGNTLKGDVGEGGWRGAFVAGLVVGGVLLAFLHPGAFDFETGRSLAVVGAAGLVVGFGTRLGSGCTSGHGICGISRFSGRSIVATLVFMATGAVTVLLFNILG